MSSIKSHSAILLDRLKEELSIERDNELADFLGKAQSTIPTWRKRSSRLPLDLIIAKCDEQGIRVDWNYVIHGERVGYVQEGMQPYSRATKPGKDQIPLFLVPAPAGATTPGDDYVEQMIDARQLFMGKADAFACRVVGDSMSGAGMTSGDIVVCDRQRNPQPGDVIVCSVDGGMTIKRYQQIGERVFLYPENDRYEVMEIIEGMNLRVWGVVFRLVRAVGNTTL